MKTRSFEILVLLFILVLAAYLRLANVAENPGWYSDEGTDVEITLNLLHGKTQYLAITQSTLLVARPPLFHILLVGWFRMFGAGIETLRAFTGWLGVLSVFLLYVAVRTAQGRNGAPLGLLAALMLAIYPQAVVYSRMGYIYNLLTPLVISSFLGMSQYLDAARGRSVWLGLAALSIGVGAAAVLMMLMFVPVLILVVTLRRWRDLLWSVPLLVLPFGLYAIAMLISAPQAFWFDLNFVLFRVGRAPWIIQLPAAVLNYAALLAQDDWLAPAIIGLFMLRPLRWRGLSLLLFFLPLFLLARTTGLADLGFYYLIPLFPFVALGMAALIRYGVPRVAQTIRSGLESLFQTYKWPPARPVGQRLRARALALGVSLALFLVVLSPFLIVTFLTVGQVQSDFHTVIDPVLVNPRDARQAAEFVNGQVRPDDLVIASPALAWLLRAHTADFQLVIAASGKATRHLPADIPPERFAYDVRYTQARFVIVDKVWRNWAARNMP
jgi:4-amino-4-deoxy-L-arabinose transferase-like glycosyltransferase